MKTLLQLPAGREFLPLATGFVEQSARAYGFEPEVALSLVLATEEIFVSLCGLPGAGEGLALETRDGRYYVEAKATVKAGALDLHAFNLTANAAPGSEEALADLGLYLAARSVDSLRLSYQAGRSVTLTMRKERQYPGYPDSGRLDFSAAGAFRIATPDAEELKVLAAMAAARYGGPLFPECLRYPGKAADMLAAGDLRAAMAVCGGGAIAGGVFWLTGGLKTVEMLGPYVFQMEQAGGMETALIEACVRDKSHDAVVGLFRRLAPGMAPSVQFEDLGEMPLELDGGQRIAVTYAYRHMREDDGSVVYSHPAVETFLRDTYGRLALPREVRTVNPLGERQQERSVLACEFVLPASHVTLRPLAAGADAARNLQTHAAYLTRQGIRNLSFEMDLGHAWEASFTPALLACGFVPAVVVPNAGDADLLLFRRER